LWVFFFIFIFGRLCNGELGFGLLLFGSEEIERLKLRALVGYGEESWGPSVFVVVDLGVAAASSMAGSG
jgi:hypothetical protein